MVRGSGFAYRRAHIANMVNPGEWGATLYRTNRFGADPIASFVGETFVNTVWRCTAFDAASNTLVIGL